MMKLSLIILLSSCAGGLPAEDVSNLENASRTTAAAYKYQDADTPAASLIRASHCSVQAVIRNEKLDTFDSGIPCQ
ncbi:MAG: hypothetical protein WBY94_04530 [Polyangiaceae bacterium]